MSTKTVTVDVEIDEVLSEASADDLIAEIESRTLDSSETTRLFGCLANNLREQMMLEYFAENMENITREDLEGLIKSKKE